MVKCSLNVHTIAKLKDRKSKTMAKLSKRDIREGLDSIPMETLLSPQGKKIQLTAKQKAFAKNVALGKTKAQAYREAYDTEAKPSVVATDAHKLSSRPDIVLMIDAYREAIEASKYRTPAQLRELVIHQLTLHALSEDNSPKEKLSALKMLGTVAEVGVFMERKESLVIHESSKVKADLVARLKDIVGGQIVEASDEGEELLQSLSHSKKSSPDTHPHPTPPFVDIGRANTLHNIPLTQSPPNSEDSQSPSNLEDAPLSEMDPIDPTPSDIGEVPPIEKDTMSETCKNTVLEVVDLEGKKNEV